MPDAKTIWLFRECLTQDDAIERLFNRFDATLRNAGYLPMFGQILDAILVVAPKQRNTNAGKSVVRSRVEHVFADQKSQTGLFIRTVGITRATMRIGLAIAASTEAFFCSIGAPCGR